MRSRRAGRHNVITLDGRAMVGQQRSDHGRVKADPSSQKITVVATKEKEAFHRCDTRRAPQIHPTTIASAWTWFWSRSCAHHPTQMTKKNKSNRKVGKSASSTARHNEQPEAQKQSPCCLATAIQGTDDSGVFYKNYDQLLTAQSVNKHEWYKANAAYWAAGGNGGATDDEVMVGDTGGIQDGEEGLAFLDRLCAIKPSTAQTRSPQFLQAVDLGAGVGRVTKLILLKRYGEVRLVEGDEALSKRSRGYLGRKRSSRCTFFHQNLQSLNVEMVRSWGAQDLMWVQWTFQYLVDADVVLCLQALATGLRPLTGLLVVKENRPYGTAREDRFSMDLPEGGNERYDLTRSDHHHRFLFQKAGLRVTMVEKGVETHTYALVRYES